MTEVFFHSLLLKFWLCSTLIIFIVLLRIIVPYGRFQHSGWGYLIDDRIGWLIMESPSVLVFAMCFFTRTNSITASLLTMFIFWEMHYIHRSFIYSFHYRTGRRRIPLLVIAFGFLFNIINSYLNGRYIFTFSSQYTVEWLFDFRFILGVFIFLTGFAVNLWADYTMKRQKSTSKAYVIPYGGLYHWISCPNYLGEIIEWIGWAIMTWSLPGLAFALWTIANLVPRSRANHKWYISHFPDYPDTRRALLPKLW